MKIVKDIMVCNVLSIKDTDTIYHARMLLKEKNIRHLPVLDSETNNYAGLISQGILLSHSLNIVEKYGLAGLEKRERRTLVKELMETDCETATTNMDLSSAAAFFISRKTSCLPVVEDNKLLGIITSVDFVKLSLSLLNKA